MENSIEVPQKTKNTGHVHPWLIHVNVWQNPLQYCKVISPQLNKINYFLKISNIVRHWPNLLILLAEYVYLC